MEKWKPGSPFGPTYAAVAARRQKATVILSMSVVCKHVGVRAALGTGVHKQTYQRLAKKVKRTLGTFCKTSSRTRT